MDVARWNMQQCSRCDTLTMIVKLCKEGRCRQCCANADCCSTTAPLAPPPHSDDDPPTWDDDLGGPAVYESVPAESSTALAPGSVTEEQNPEPAPGRSRGAKRRRKAARLLVRKLYQMMLAAPPQSPTPEVEMMGADVTGSCLDNSLDDPDDHLLAQQQAGLDDETLQLIKRLAALPEQTYTT